MADTDLRLDCSVYEEATSLRRRRPGRSSRRWLERSGLRPHPLQLAALRCGSVRLCRRAPLAARPVIHSAATKPRVLPMKREVLAIRHVYFEDLGSLELVLGDRGQLGALSRRRPWPHRRPDPLDPSLMVVLGGPIGAYDDALLSPSHAVALHARKAHRGRAADNRHLPRRAVDRACARCAGLSGGATGTRLDAAHAHRCGPGVRVASSRSRRPAEPVLHWHGDTFDLPDDATRLASTPACENQASRGAVTCSACNAIRKFCADRFETWLIANPVKLPASGTTMRGTCAPIPPGSARGWNAPRAGCSANGWTGSSWANTGLEELKVMRHESRSREAGGEGAGVLGQATGSPFSTEQNRSAILDRNLFPHLGNTPMSALVLTGHAAWRHACAIASSCHRCASTPPSAAKPTNGT